MVSLLLLVVSMESTSVDPSFFAPVPFPTVIGAAWLVAASGSGSLKKRDDASVLFSLAGIEALSAGAVAVTPCSSSWAALAAFTKPFRPPPFLPMPTFLSPTAFGSAPGRTISEIGRLAEALRKSQADKSTIGLQFNFMSSFVILGSSRFFPAEEISRF